MNTITCYTRVKFAIKKAGIGYEESKKRRAEKLKNKRNPL